MAVREQFSVGDSRIQKVRDLDAGPLCNCILVVKDLDSLVSASWHKP